jgi:hypothetical protein
MKLHKALKVKNRLVGEIKKLQEIICRENSRRSDNTSKIDVKEKLEELAAKVTDLGQLKTKIAIANTGIYEKIEKMAAIKDYINFFNSLPTRHGIEIQTYGDSKIEWMWTATLTKEEVEKQVAVMQEQINNLQDEIDLYNSSVEIN